MEILQNGWHWKVGKISVERAGLFLPLPFKKKKNLFRYTLNLLGLVFFFFNLPLYTCLGGSLG